MCTATASGVCETVVHERLKLDADWWARQRFIGLQAIDEKSCLEMRNCSHPGCESTLAKEVPMTPERVEAIAESRRRAREFSQMVDAARAAVHA